VATALTRGQTVQGQKRRPFPKKQGVPISSKHVSYHMMLAMQLGIRITVVTLPVLALSTGRAAPSSIRTGISIPQ